METMSITPIEIRRIQEEQFLKQKAVRGVSKESYAFDRGLLGRSDPDEIEPYMHGYLDVLPTFNGLSFIDHVEKRINYGEKPAILDIGYGMGKFLLDCRKIWNDEVILQGYGPSDQSKSEFMHSGIRNEPTSKLLEDRNIELIEGDVIDFSKIYGHEKADIIVSVTALQHVNYPQWELIKKIYRGLKPDGIAFLHWTIKVSSNLQNQLSSYLDQEGYKFEFSDNTISIRKNKPDIDLPIRTVDYGFHPKYQISNYDENLKFASRLP